MPQGKGTYGTKKGRPPKKGKKLEWLKLADKNALEGLLKQEQKHQKYVQLAKSLTKIGQFI